MDMKLEVVVLPVSDVDRSIKFFTGLGWRFDGDFHFGKVRAAQVTPPGSRCSVLFGEGITTASPGSTKGLFLVVTDLEAARRELMDKGVVVSEPFHRDDNGKDVPGPDPQGRSYMSYAGFSDPDGNTFLLQEITQRLPGRAEGETEFHSEGELAGALKRAEAAHGEHEKRLGGQRDAGWPAWYAQYMTREQSGGPLPQ